MPSGWNRRYFLGSGEKVWTIIFREAEQQNRTVGRDYCFRFDMVLMHKFLEPLAQPYIPSPRLDGHHDFFMGFVSAKQRGPRQAVLDSKVEISESRGNGFAAGQPYRIVLLCRVGLQTILFLQLGFRVVFGRVLHPRYFKIPHDHRKL